MTLNALGEARQQAGDRDGAHGTYLRAVAASQRCGSEHEQARAHRRLGQLAADSGDTQTARLHWTRAMAGYRRVGAAEAATVAACLDGLVDT